MFCPQCAKPNDDSAKFCIGCGASLAPVTLSPVEAEAAELRQQEEFYKAFIGPKNQYYYLSRFQDFDRVGKAGASWHWPAFFATFYWLLYRKMWGLAALYYFLPYLLAVPFGALAATAGDATAGLGFVAYLAATFVLVPLYANALYYRRCKKKIAEVKGLTNDVQRQLGLLSGRGGTSWILLLIIGSFFFIAVIGILAAVALPAYADYTTRTRVLQALSVGRSAANAVEDYRYKHGAAPASLADAGFSTPPSLPVTEIELDRETGVVAIGFSDRSVEGYLLLVPSEDEKGRISWGCRSDDIKNKYLPQQCRSQE